MTERTLDDLTDESSERVTEPVHDQISAFLDDELSEEEAAFLVRRFTRDPEARNRLLRYSIVGSALRDELLRPDPDVLRRRVAGALSGAPAVVAARGAIAAGHPWRARAVRPLLGVGIAAAVAVAAVVALRSVNEARVDPQSTLNQMPVQARQWVEPPSYVVPRDAAESLPVALPPIRLTNYLMHHGEYASRLSRTSVHSNVVGASVPSPKVEDQPELE